MKRIAVVLVLAGLGAGATALAQDGDDPYQLPEPDVTSRQVLHVRAPSRCGEGEKATVRITPPAGAVIGSLRVHLRGLEVVRLTGVPRAASVTVRMPRGGGRLTATGETLGGQELRATRIFQPCPVVPTSPVGGGPLREGGGED